ncbi:MAG: MFS transporter [Rhizobiaceae bacterium]
MTDATKAQVENNQNVDRRNYSLILSSGVASSTAGQLISPTLVLPFLYLALDAPVIVAGLLLPFMWGASLIAELVAAPFLTRTTRAKIYVVLPTLFSAFALVALALSSEGASPLIIAALFLAVAVILGFCKGISNVGYGQLFGVVVPSDKRNRVTFTEAMAGGLVAILVVFVTQDFLASESPLQRHITVLWAGIVASIAGALIIYGVRLLEEAEREESEVDPEKKAEPEKKSHGIKFGDSLRQIASNLKQGLETGARYAWFRHYVAARILFLSVTLALPFFTIHASGFHKGTPHGLSILVVATSAGVVAGSLIWGWLAGRSRKQVMIASCFLGAAAILLALALDFTNMITRISLYAVAVFLVAFAGNGVVNGRYLYFIDMTKKKERPNLMALSDLVVGVLAIGLASILGIVAHYADPTIPLMVLLAFCLAAGFYSLSLVEPGSQTRNEKPLHRHTEI